MKKLLAILVLIMPILAQASDKNNQFMTYTTNVNSVMCYYLPTSGMCSNGFTTFKPQEFVDGYVGHHVKVINFTYVLTEKSKLIIEYENE